MPVAEVIREGLRYGCPLTSEFRVVEHSAWLETVKDNCRRAGMLDTAARLLLLIEPHEKDPFILAYLATRPGEGVGAEGWFVGVERFPYNPDHFGWVSPRIDYLVEQAMPEARHVALIRSRLGGKRWEEDAAVMESQAERLDLAKHTKKTSPELGRALEQGIMPFVGERESARLGMESTTETLKDLSNAHERVISIHGVAARKTSH